ncbi:transcription factor GTE2-like [Histomonas meleagridis]|uniref:transcription factor GTE2-like n=1 Tax=Histomonas meleagridis TaxID=135588 RepID=UPI00355AB0E7|nr:transcription factor GTE2-like [Histomonas meleagridis]KAH0804490.1 transcription factor GTE2-like [Histomonas meleagridis]
MEQTQKEICIKIMKSILENPISKLFWNFAPDATNPNIAHPLSLEYISTRLSNDKYSLPSDFIMDLRLCFQNGKAGEPQGTIRHASAQQLLVDLDSMVAKLQPLANPKVLRLQLITSEFEDNLSFPEYSQLPREVNEPHAQIFDTDPDPSDTATLLRDIKFLTSPDLTAKLAVFITKIQPEVVIVAEEITFNIYLLTDENRIIVRKFVTQLLKDAASGKMDPFSRPFGVVVKPMKVQERRMFFNEM